MATQSMPLRAALALVESLMTAAFDRPRDARSAAYKLGVRQLLNCRTRDVDLVCPYKIGTTEADAFYSGVDEGNLIWRAHLAAAPSGADRAALEVAHSQLRATNPLDDMLKNPALRTVLMTVARRHMRRRSQFDAKKLQANDND